MRLCRRFVVSGRVQGVGYRAWTRDHARRLRLTGWVANLADGRVEVLACGDPDALAALRARLHEGPWAAHVTAVDEEAGDAQAGGTAGFLVR